MTKTGLIITIFLVSCSNSEREHNFDNLKKVRKGIKIAEVHSLMRNSPVDTQSAYWSDSLFVERYESVIGSSDYYKIIYFKEDSTVADLDLGD
jgi:hypothetical protein